MVVDKFFCNQRKERAMLCNHCREHIEVGEACRAEPVEAGSQHHRFFHLGCYGKAKAERQQEDGQLQFQLSLAVEQARSVC